MTSKLEFSFTIQNIKLSSKWPLNAMIINECQLSLIITLLTLLVEKTYAES